MNERQARKNKELNEKEGTQKIPKEKNQSRSRKQKQATGKYFLCKLCLMFTDLTGMIQSELDFEI